MWLRCMTLLLGVGALLAACTTDNSSTSIERMQLNQRAAMQTAA